MTGISISSNFDTAAQEVMAFLHQRLGFDLWMVTRKEGEDWLVLQTHDQGGYRMQNGAVFRWNDSFCARMVCGEGPRIAPKSYEIEAYAQAPISKQVAIASYAGVPLYYEDGSLFGTLCAIHPISQPETIEAELPLIELLGELLSRLLNTELRALQHHHSETQARALCFQN